MRRQPISVALGNALIQCLARQMPFDSRWSEVFKSRPPNKHRRGIHLAVFVEPFLTKILQGKKTVESRFAKKRIAPYQLVKEGDILILKASSGPVLGVCEVGQVWFYRLDPGVRDSIRRDYSVALCAEDPSFWEQRTGASYATLMQIKSVMALSPVRVSKRDRRGWVVIKESNGAD